MQLKPRNFPWRLFRKFLYKSAALFLAIFIVIYFLVHALIKKYLLSTYPAVDWSDFLRTIMVIGVAGTFLLFVGMAAFTFWELLLPLGSVYSRMKSIREQSDASLLKDLDRLEPGEWSDIEVAIEDIRQKLNRSEKRFTRDRETLDILMNALPEAVFAVDLQNHPIFYNRSFLKVFGLEKQDVSSKRISEFIRSPQVIEAFESTLTSNRVHKVEARLHTEDDRDHVFHITVAPLSDSGSDLTYGAISVFQDVTELKQLEQIRIDFVANVSHELRTPLTSVKGYAQTLLEDVKARRFDQGEKYLEVVTRNVDRLLILVNDLLDLSSLDSGLVLQPTAVDTKKLTENILEQLEPLRQKKHIQIETGFKATKVRADETRAQQVLTNLLQNAIQYVPANKTISVTWMRVPNGVELHVQDNGPGISQEQQTRIFERFYRVDRARSRESGGTGLGLSIVKHIMQRHGGAVRVQSQVGVGTEFICYFPDQEEKS